MQVALGISLGIVPVLLLPGAAQALETRCAIPIQHNASKSGLSRPAITPEPRPTSKPLSPQAAFARKHGSRLATCRVQLGPAKLSGQQGILITTTDPKQNKTTIFCLHSPSRNCVVRSAQPREASRVWAKASITKTAIARGQFAYRITTEAPHTLLVIVFGPDIAVYRHLAPALTSDPAQ